MPATGDILTDEQCEKALEQISAGGPDSSVNACARSLGVTWNTVHEALERRFGLRYARAKELRNRRMAEEILEISDDSSNDYIEREVGEGVTIQVVNHEHINRARLRVDSRKWLLSKLLPKEFGDKKDPESESTDKTVRIVGGLPDA